MKIIRLSFVLALFFAVTSSCKKGAGDPAISFKSRKARMAGEWHLKFGNAGLTFAKTGQPSFSQSFVLDGNQAKESETPSGGTPTLYIFAYLLHLSIKKDGTFSMSENYGSYALEASGKWNFTSGVGDSKNKDAILFIIDKVDAGNTGSHLFNKETTEFTYKIQTLKDKEIRLEAGTSEYLGVGGENVTFTGTFDFVQ